MEKVRLWDNKDLNDYIKQLENTVYHIDIPFMVIPTAKGLAIKDLRKNDQDARD